MWTRMGNILSMNGNDVMHFLYFGLGNRFQEKNHSLPSESFLGYVFADRHRSAQLPKMTANIANQHILILQNLFLGIMY